MAQRMPIIGGNWKMNLDRQEGGPSGRSDRAMHKSARIRRRGPVSPLPLLWIMSTKSFKGQSTTDPSVHRSNWARKTVMTNPTVPLPVR